MVAVTAKGEVVSIQEADQFQPAKTQFACGFFACAMARTMSKPGSPATNDAATVIKNAEQWYAQYNGSDAASNEAGMTNEQEYELLHQIGLHYQAIDPQIEQVKAWVQAGYPVLIAITETSVHDLALDGANPYPWTPAGTHIILVTGVKDNNVLARDSANVSSLANPNALRPGPRLYEASRLQLVSATVVVPPWRPRPASATAIPADDQHIPAGWTDDGTTLTAPNGVKVTLGFRSYILKNGWDAKDWPMHEEQGANPVEAGYSQPDGDNGGTRIITMYSELCWTEKRGVYVASVGRELWVSLQAAKPAPNGTARTNAQAAAKLISDTATQLIAEVAQI